MKTKILIILIIVILLVISVFVFKGMSGIVVDKTGMVRNLEDDIVLIRYSTSGGMEGESECIELSLSEEGECSLSYSAASYTSDYEKEKTISVPLEAMNEIRRICKEYQIFSWGKLEKSDVLLLDAPVTTVMVSTGAESVSYRSDHELPESADGITSRIYKVLESYLEGVD